MKRKLTRPEKVLFSTLTAGCVLYAFGPYFSDHLMIAGIGLLIGGFLVLVAAIGQNVRSNT